ncbi:MAG: hypothetical protein BEN18_09885 [Epulopiscium sp. Nuni2H_MBin001]|nr:MAG: hypothetical protein BEN18_09885 [Epulopiscium sp. Nuni2H_MBin001]
MKVIVAEKPSVAKNIADALGIKIREDGYFKNNKYFVTWSYGHLLTLWDSKDYNEIMARWNMQNFPFVPNEYKYKVNQGRGSLKYALPRQLNCIKNLVELDEVDEVISAFDYDREGQIIGDIIFQYLKVRKPISRLLLNEWTEAEVLNGLKSLVSNNELRPLRDSGLCRQHADWLIGINLTSVATLRYRHGKEMFNIGRVLLPTLKLIYDREQEIANFKSATYFKLQGLFAVADKSYLGVYNLPNNPYAPKFDDETNNKADNKDNQDKTGSSKNEKFCDKAFLDNLANEIKGKKAVIIDKTTNLKNEYPPPLYNLTGLQGDISSKHKHLTADKVLKLAQSLYEKKNITYPRTASTVLDESLKDKVSSVLNVVKKGREYESEIVFHDNKRVFNSAKVESHSAIIPTYQRVKDITADEEIVYNAIVNRFIMQFMPIAVYEETVITTEVEDVAGYFLTRGRIQKTIGFKKVEMVATKDVILPPLDLYEISKVDKAEVKKHETKPPKYYNEKTLLRAMETCGKQYKEDEDILEGFSIGTPATRADTIKKLGDVNYIIKDRKNLKCSAKGKFIIESLPVSELMDLEYTGRLEKTLADMEKGLVSKSEFMKHIEEFVYSAVAEIKIQTISAAFIHQQLNAADTAKTAKTAADVGKEVLGHCPLCNGDVVEGKLGYGCLGYKAGCKFVLWKHDETFKKFNKKLTKTAVKALLKNGSVLVKGFITPSKTKFDAIISFEYDGQNANWKFIRP